MRKNIYAIILLTISAFLKTNAQSFQIIDTTGAMSVAQTSYIVNVDSDSANTILFYVKNTTSGQINLQGKSYIISNQRSANMQYCIGTQCHGAGTPITTNVSVPGNGTLTANGLLLDFYDYGLTGNDAMVSYTLFNALHPNDSVNMVVTYHITSVTGIKQNVANYSVSNIAPNPANNNVSLSYDLKNSTQPATVKIYNMLGTLVKTSPLEVYTNNTKIDISSLEEGMYFYSVTVGSKVVKTSRLVVAR